MMAFTHLTIGLATSIAILQPKQFKDYLPVFAGAAIGSIICDFDCRSEKGMRDALYGRIAAFAIFVIAALVDLIIKGKMTSYIFENKSNKILLFALVVFIGTSLGAVFSEHRKFSHSLLAMILYGVSLCFVCFPLFLPFIIGYISHILLDLTNKKPVLLLWPSEKEFYLKWFYASETANTVFLVIGCIGLVAAIASTIIL